MQQHVRVPQSLIAHLAPVRVVEDLLARLGQLEDGAFLQIIVFFLFRICAMIYGYQVCTTDAKLNGFKCLITFP